MKAKTGKAKRAPCNPEMGTGAARLKGGSSYGTDASNGRKRTGSPRPK